MEKSGKASGLNRRDLRYVEWVYTARRPKRTEERNVMRSLRTITGIGVAAAGIASTFVLASPAHASNPAGEEYVGGDWISVFIEGNSVLGTTGAVHKRVYLDRANS